MRVFTILPLTHWRDAAPAAKAAEAAGFDALMSVELRHDPFTPLALAALATERVELTPSGAIAFPRSPTVMVFESPKITGESSSFGSTPTSPMSARSC